MSVNFGHSNSYQEYQDMLNTMKDYLVLSIADNGDGPIYYAEMKCDNEKISLQFSYDTIDAYIYALNDIKQKLELQRIKHGKA